MGETGSEGARGDAHASESARARAHPVSVNIWRFLLHREQLRVHIVLESSRLLHEVAIATGPDGCGGRSGTGSVGAEIWLDALQHFETLWELSFVVEEAEGEQEGELEGEEKGNEKGGEEGEGVEDMRVGGAAGQVEEGAC